MGIIIFLAKLCFNFIYLAATRLLPELFFVAHVDLEGLTLDSQVRRLKDRCTQKLAEIIYNGFWFSAEREFLMASVSHSQKLVNGVVRIKLYKGNVFIEGRSSPNSLYDEKIASMNETDGFYPVDSDKIQSIRATPSGLVHGFRQVFL